jgi:hypothetical protein
MLVRVSHRPTRWILPVLLLSGLLLAAAIIPLHVRAVRPNPPSVRFATFNASLNRASAGLAQSDLSMPFDPNETNASLRLRRGQAAKVAEVIQRVRPDVLLINEFDYAPATEQLPASIDSFRANYLEIPQNVLEIPGNVAEPIDYPFAYTAESNTGIPSGFDLDNNGSVGGPNDAFGFGFFPGQYGMAVFSKYPIDAGAIRTFQHFLWKDMPGALLPHYPDAYEPNPELAGDPWYSPEELDVFRLSSKSHWDIPILVRGKIVHFLVSHPTPPVFDGVEDRNGTRNFDEIRFWADYITPDEADYIYDDDGVYGGLAPGSAFVIAGDENSDPLDGDSIPGAIQQLIEHPLVNATNTPDSLGGPEQSLLQGGVNLTHRSDPAFDTADFAEPPGNLHADYVLPRDNLEILDSAVFWPLHNDPLFGLVGVFSFSLIEIGGFPTSDHRLVWIDVRLPTTSR